MYTHKRLGKIMV